MNSKQRLAIITSSLLWCSLTIAATKQPNIVFIFSDDHAYQAISAYGDERKLHLHPTAVVNDALFNLSSGEITVEEYAFFGHGVAVLTGTHDITTFDRERQVAVPKGGRDVVIGRGAWISTNALVLGPCRIGEHAVVAAGSVVNADVPPYTVVGGVPARVLSTITERPS